MRTRLSRQYELPNKVSCSNEHIRWLINLLNNGESMNNLIKSTTNFHSLVKPKTMNVYLDKIFNEKILLIVLWWIPCRVIQQNFSSAVSKRYETKFQVSNMKGTSIRTRKIKRIFSIEMNSLRSYNYNLHKTKITILYFLLFRISLYRTWKLLGRSLQVNSFTFYVLLVFKPVSIVIMFGWIFLKQHQNNTFATYR